MSPKPPCLPELLLGHLVPPGEREFLMGDLQERYGDLLAAKGRTIAHAWYWMQVVKALLSLPNLWRAQRSGRRHESQRLSRGPVRQAASIVLFNLRVALHTLRRAPVFSLGVILTVSLGIGANASMFGILDRILLRPPQHLAEPDQIHRVYRLYRQERLGTWALAQDRSYEDFVALKRAKSLSMIAGYIPATMMTLGSGLEAERVRGVMSSSEFFPLLGVQPRMGRFFDAEDDRVGAPLTAVLGYGYWQRRFGGDPSVLGRTVEVYGGRATVVGVTPEGFTGVDLYPVDIWLPIQPAMTVLTGSPTAWRTSYWPQMVCRLRPGIAPETAQDEATAVYLASREEAGKVGKYDLDLRILLGSVVEARVPKGAEGVEGTQRPVSLRVTKWLAGISIFVFLIACANVANLLLARATDRKRELAVRLAVGGSRTRLVGELSSEAFVLAALGGLGALVVGRWGGEMVRNLLLPEVDWSGSGLDSRLLGFTLIMALLAGLAAGVWPAIQAGIVSPNGILGGGTRGASSRTTGMSRRLASLQLAVSVLLLTGAGLFVRSLVAFRSRDGGMDVDRVATVRLQFEEGSLDSAETDRRYRAVAERLARLPAVSSVGLTSVPFGSGRYGTISVPGIDSIPIVPPDPGVFEQWVDSEYFSTLGIDVIEGRTLDPEDEREASLVLVVNRLMAQTLWPGESALGKCVRVGGQGAGCSTVVGVVEDVIRSPRQVAGGPRFMQYYLPLPMSSARASGAYVRVASRDAAILTQIRREAIRTVPGIRTASVEILRTALDPQSRPWVLGAGMLTLFGVLALLVSGIGLFSVLAYAVARRRRELGIRAAVGASRGSLLSLVLRDGLHITATGLLLGSGMVLVAGPWARPLLLDVSPRDPVVWGTVMLTLLLLSLVSSLIPAVRACQADPVAGMRSE